MMLEPDMKMIKKLAMLEDYNTLLWIYKKYGCLMLWGEYRQEDLKENLKYKMDWIVKAYRYKKFIEIENKAELEFLNNDR